MTIVNIDNELLPLVKVLARLREEGKIRIALLYGSFADGLPHKRSDVDIAVFAGAMGREEEVAMQSEIMSSLEREVAILRLDDEDESPFIVQAALKGRHLVEPDYDLLYHVADWALHQSEDIRFRRAAHV